ncbi:hypothetical protein D9758_006179 [Tetrapyrgos nigripes]|uniref:NAD-dependent epimerase/dehydratase domain-containing protein n=1 Tax=Tetrapyrgos nigripes TaxID=182062 RepID=A0A8H5GAN2_9AGAR|nr:hypothetical protein D9758_006179 [Tetrapyrgos nigripes]
MSLKQESRPRILITGGYGFIGSHIVARLSVMKVGSIRVADLSESAHSRLPEHEFMLGNLCDEAFCRKVVRDIDVVIHTAANMGGMGCIRDENDFVIYKENHTITMNLLEACVEAGMKDFLYASSACAYPNNLQSDSTSDVSLRESDITFPPDPQGLYGLEKLNSEALLHNLPSRMNIHIVRFHNVFGPNGAWHNGREKAPAAMLRKAYAWKFLGDSSVPFEIWGTGDQRRSFLYIDDAVEGVVQSLQSGEKGPFNIGSDHSVSIKELADIALRHAGVDPSSVPFIFDLTKPVGVASRNSNNDKSSSELGWIPKTSLEEGMRRTGIWVEEEMQRILGACKDEEQKRSILMKWMSSDLVDMALEKNIVFAILLPVSSRGLGVETCLSNLRQLAQSLGETTWRDTHSLGGTRFRVKVYLVLDRDDEALYLEGTYNKARDALNDGEILDVVTLVRDDSNTPLCSLWRDCARKAWEDGCHYMLLLAEDVMFHDEGWMRKTHHQYKQFSAKHGVPLGFGCVSLTDISSSDMPTIPIIHRTHLDIFQGQVIPQGFTELYLFNLYQEYFCSAMIPSRISNTVGYQKLDLLDWTSSTVEDRGRKIEEWLRARSCQVLRRRLN